MFRRILPTVFCLCFVVSSQIQAAPDDDLVKGKELVAQGSLAEALPLLRSAAEALPESVDAQLSLGECLLKLGRLDVALDQYRKVLKLSPQHRQAKAVVAGLTQARPRFDEAMDAARHLMAVGAFPEAASVLQRLVTQPLDQQQRQQARLLSLEATLWNGGKESTLAEALQLAATSTDEATAAQARLIGALALVARNRSDDVWSRAVQIAGDLGQVPEAWKPRAAILEVLASLGDEQTHGAISAGLRTTFASVPESKWLHSVREHTAYTLLKSAEAKIESNQSNQALAIIWPMVSDQPIPNSLAGYPEVDLNQGWVPDQAATAKPRARIAHVFASLARAQYLNSRRTADAGGFWFAFEVVRQTPSAANSIDLQLGYATEIAGYSRVDKDYQPGTVISPADQLQQRLLTVALQPITEAHRVKIVDLAMAQIQRYRAAGSTEFGLSQFVVVAAQNDEVPNKVAFVGQLDNMVAGGAQQKLMQHVARVYLELAQQKFQKQAATLTANVNQKLDRNDSIALLWAGILSARYAGDRAAEQIVNDVVQRFAGIESWEAASTALATYRAAAGMDTRLWDGIQLQIRQTRMAEDKHLGVNRRLPNELPEVLTAAITSSLEILKQDDRDPARTTAIAVWQPVVQRYSALQRADLARKVIDALAAGEASRMVDWAGWMRIELLELEGRRQLVEDAAKFGMDEITLNPFHQQELKLISQLVKSDNQSGYRQSAVERVFQISGAYEANRAYAVATQVLKDFLADHGDLSVVERMEYQIVGISIRRATHAFGERPDKQKAPAELLGEHQEAIEALTTFLKARSTGQYASAAEQELLGIARLYGQAGGWSVARGVLDAFAAAIPDYRHPLQIRLWKAATHIGELDRAYGLQLLSPVPRRTSRHGGAGEKVAAAAEAPTNAPAVNDPFGDGGDSDEAETVDRLRGNADGVLLGKNSAGDAGGGFGGGGFAGGAGPGMDSRADMPAGGYSYNLESAASRPSQSALAMIRQSQQRQYQQLAMMKDLESNKRKAQKQDQAQQGGQQAVALPSGSVLSEAEMKRQDEAADEAYQILLAIVREGAADGAVESDFARAQILWLFGFFEGQLRADQAIVLIQRFLKDQPQDPAKLALAFRAIEDRLAWAAQANENDRRDLAWLDKHHQLFEAARKHIQEFIKEFSDKSEWVNRAHLLMADSFQREAAMAALVSRVRAGGLLVRSADTLTNLLTTAPDHPQVESFPQRLWNVAEQLRALQQQDAAIYVLSQITIRFPTHALAQNSVLRIAELHATNLQDPLKAVEAYQEYLSLNGDHQQIRTQIFTIAQQLGAKQRYLESLYVYGVFVDSFPTDPRASTALEAIGNTQKTNESWEEAIATFDRILVEYPSAPLVPRVKLAVAECRINLSQWREVRKLYAEFVSQYPKDGSVAMARTRLAVLKNLDRYQTLLADDQVQRNKDDAQYQIGRLVLSQLNNPVKAVQEFRKVVDQYPKSDVADDAQLEIGKALIALNRMDDARTALLEVPVLYPNSPLADDALYLIAQSYEQQAVRLTSVTLAAVRDEAFMENQKGAYQSFNEQVVRQREAAQMRRGQLKKEGKSKELALDEAADAFRLNTLAISGLSGNARKAEQQAETESALEVANRQDRINDAYREAVKLYMQAASEYPLGDKTDDSLLRIAQIFETQLKDRSSAMETYQKIVKLFPGTPVAEDAAWKVAVFYEQEAKYTLAAAGFREFIRNYPASNRVADAQFALAEVLEQLGLWVEAMDAYETFRQKFGSHPKAVVAQEQINWIKTYRK